MLRKITLVAALVVSSLVSAQSYFGTNIQEITTGPKYGQGTAELLNDSAVVEVEGKTAKELYDSAVKYVTKTYIDPDAVSKGNIDGEYLSFRGITSIPIKIKILGNAKPNTFNYRYYITLHFKDGRFKMDLVSWEVGSGVVFNKAVRGWITKDRKGKYSPEGKHNIDQFRSTLDNIVQGLLDEMTGANSSNNDW